MYLVFLFSNRNKDAVEILFDIYGEGWHNKESRLGTTYFTVTPAALKHIRSIPNSAKGRFKKV